MMEDTGVWFVCFLISSLVMKLPPHYASDLSRCLESNASNSSLGQLFAATFHSCTAELTVQFACRTSAWPSVKTSLTRSCSVG